MRTAIRKQLRNFVAILVLVAIAAVVGGYILINQRLARPAGLPLVGVKYKTLYGEFATAQAVTPGQGQSVNIAGVPVGEIAKVELKDGRALVEMHVKPKFFKIHPDATMLLRPRTGLKDMFVELTPGSRNLPRVEDGFTVPISQTLPDVNLDEILATLDGDTRSYLQVLLAGAGEGLRGNDRNLASTLRTFNPIARDLAKANGLLAQRRSNLKRVIHNFSLLADELGSKDRSVARLVDSSNAVFATFARQDANLRSALRQLPGALGETRTALGKVDTLARTLGPSLETLRPAARNLAPALRSTRPFAREAAPIIANQIRPFARAARPTVRDLRPAARDLSALTPSLRSSFRTINYLFNELAYNPPGERDEGYLFWFAWVNHLGNSIFNAQDAHGPIRRGQVITNCTGLSLFNAIGGNLTAVPGAPAGTLGPDPSGAPEGQTGLNAQLLQPPSPSHVGCPVAGAAERADVRSAIRTARGGK